MPHRRSKQYVLVLRRGTADEMSEHFPRCYKTKSRSKRCLAARRTARKLAADHIRLYGASYYKKKAPAVRRRRYLVGGGCCPGGCL